MIVQNAKRKYYDQTKTYDFMNFVKFDAPEMMSANAITPVLYLECSFGYEMFLFSVTK